MRMHYLQHVAFETPGNIETYYREKGYSVSASHLYKGEQLPDLHTLDVLVIMGGPMNVNDEDEYPWLQSEKNYIKEALAEGKKVLGICLGAQLIAHTLGGKVFPGPYKEIGWLPIRKVDQRDLSEDGRERKFVFHWHGDTFDLPSGAELTYVSDNGIKQGYVIKDQVLALQCHLEMTQEGVEALVLNNHSDLEEEGPYIQKAEMILAMKDHYRANKEFLYHLLDQFSQS